MKVIQKLKSLEAGLLLCLFILGVEAYAGGNSLEPVDKGARLGGSYQKPGAPVQLEHNYDGKTELAEVEAIDLYITPNFTLQNMEVKVSSTSNILGGQEFIFSDVAPGSVPVHIPVSVSATEVGRYYINVFVTSNARGAVSARSFALPVMVGDVPKKQSKASVIGGERVIMMPAEETVE